MPAELSSRRIQVSVAAVGRLMEEIGILGACSQAPTITTRPDRHASRSDDLITRNFTVDELDTLSVSDLTEIGTREGWLDLVTIVDACQRRIRGDELGDALETQLVTRALGQATATRGRRWYRGQLSMQRPRLTLHQ